MPAQDVTLAARFAKNLAPIDSSSKGNIICFVGEGNDTYLSLGTWSDDAADNNTPGKITAATYLTKMAFFKWGGLVGFDLTGTTFTETASDTNAVKFNPQTTTPVTSYWTIGYQTANYNDVSPTLSEVQAGRGDQCKLIGITNAQIRSFTTQEQLDAALAARPDAYKGWKLPSNPNNQTFTGVGGFSSTYDNATQIVKSGGWASLDDPGVLTFTNSGNAKLPAAGYRGGDGNPGTLGSVGGYWSLGGGKTDTYDFGYVMTYDKNKITIYQDTIRYRGYGVRCVK